MQINADEIRVPTNWSLDDRLNHCEGCNYTFKERNNQQYHTVLECLKVISDRSEEATSYILDRLNTHPNA